MATYRYATPEQGAAMERRLMEKITIKQAPRHPRGTVARIHTTRPLGWLVYVDGKQRGPLFHRRCEAAEWAKSLRPEAVSVVRRA